MKRNLREEVGEEAEVLITSVTELNSLEMGYWLFGDLELDVLFEVRKEVEKRKECLIKLRGIKIREEVISVGIYGTGPVALGVPSAMMDLSNENSEGWSLVRTKNGNSSKLAVKRKNSLENVQQENSSKKIAMPMMTTTEDRQQLLYPDNHVGRASVFVQMKDSRKKGGKSLLNMAKIVSDLNMGAEELLPRGFQRAEIKFKSAKQANEFVQQCSLDDMGLRAYIPKHLLERKGVIKGFDIDLDPNDLITHSSSPCNIKMVKRLNKRRINKEAGKTEWVPSQTVLLTFEGTTLPNFVKVYNLSRSSGVVEDRRECCIVFRDLREFDCSTAGVIPEFSGSDIGEDANSWCKVVEEITKACSTQVRLNLATHALRGPAKSWYHDWKGQPRTWEKFCEDLCSVFVTRKNLHERLSRAVAYNSDSAKTYAEYARTKLFYLEQTRVAFQTEELIELIIGAVTDQTIRQSLLNGQYKTTAELIVGLTQFVKPTTEKEASEDRRKEQADKQQRGKKRCYSCDEVGHIQVNCPKKRKLEQKEKPGKRLTCTFCSKKGHEESNCWAKQRAPSQPGRKRAEANICSLADCKTTPVLIQGVLVPSLLDTGADCSLIKESVARKANCKVMPSATIVRGLGNVSVTTLGRTTVILQAEDASVELDFLVVADEDLAYDAIVGRNVLEGGNLRLVTSAEGTRLQRVDETSSPEKRTVGQCYVVGSGNSDERSVLESLIGKYQHMIAPTDSSRCVTTGEMKINTKSDQGSSVVQVVQQRPKENFRKRESGSTSSQIELSRRND
ncbi:uncharacterized protein LOC143265934 [Megachile rotundata]|uniref:uncharacterized protein LOC143265934 n=1 Tax=Megachile rotundata TaxID=143995 RepID=UPI003FD42419